MKKLMIIISSVTALMATGCASTFVASKDGKGYHLGNSSDAAYEMFCQSGDMEKILSGTTFDEQLKKNLYQYNCGAERSNGKVKEIFSALSPAQRKELRLAFKKNGYDINIMRC